MADDREARQQELARLLMRKALQDLEALKALLPNPAIADEVIGFHAQQAIEKGIKAALTRLGVQYNFTHDLSVLFQQVTDTGLEVPVSREAVEELTAFAVQFRYTLYEDEAGLDRPAKIQLAEKFIQWASQVVETPIRLSAK